MEGIPGGLEVDLHLFGIECTIREAPECVAGVVDGAPEPLLAKVAEPASIALEADVVLQIQYSLWFQVLNYRSEQKGSLQNSWWTN